MFIRSACRALSLFLLLVLGFVGELRAAKVPLSGAPAWVQQIPVKLTTQVKPKEVSAGYHTLLRDAQYDLATQTEYQHQAYVVFSEDGLQEISEIRVDYDPNYQQLAFHNVRIWRDGKPIDKTAGAGYKVIQREKELEKHIYNEKLTAVIILEDVRLNDVLEYAFSLRGWNPIFNNKFCNTHYLQSYDPIDELFISIRSTPDHPLYIKSENTQVKPTTQTAGDNKFFTWHLKNLPAFSMDSDAPSWYDPYPCVYVSEFKNWGEIVAWAQPLFDVKEPLSTALLEEVNRIKKEHGSSEGRLAAATRFVQDKIRYLGMENGISGYKPFPPAQIMKQRFGDCKDKSLLLATMLRQMDIAAYPALVNTNYQDQVKNWQPTFYAFNHCIVVAELFGKQVWIDPTISLQRGLADSISTPDYKEALVLKKGNQQFTRLTVPHNSKIKITESYTFKDIGGPANLLVETEYFGYEADMQRSRFAANTTKQIEKDYLNYYANQFPGIAIERELEFTDDEEDNKFTTLEEYTIEDLWTKDESADDNILRANFYPQVLRDRLVMPSTIIRKMPIGLNYPLHMEQTINLHMPEDWPVNPAVNTIENKSFFYRSHIQYHPKSNLITITYKYKNLRDYVPVAEAKDYIKKQKLILNDLGYQLTNNLDAAKRIASFSFNWLMLAVLLAALMAGSFGAYKLYWAYDPPQLTYEPTGMPIGGWLILVIIGLGLTPLRIISHIITSDSYFNLSLWQEITNVASISYNPLLAFSLVFEIIGNIGTFIYSILIIALFINRRTSLPRLITFFYSGNLAFILLDVALVSQLHLENNSLGAEIISPLVACLIWIPYFNISERVKETFVNRLSAPETEEELQAEKENEAIAGY